MNEDFTFQPEQLDPAVRRGLLDVATIDLERGPGALSGIATLTAVLYARHPQEVQAFFLNPERLEQLVGEVDPNHILRWGPMKLREATELWVDKAWRGRDANIRDGEEQGVSTQIDPTVVKLLNESAVIAKRANRSLSCVADVISAFAEQPEIRERLYKETGLIIRGHSRHETPS